MIDPREAIIDENLKNVKRIIAVSGGKGGIGKSVVSSVLALALTKSGEKVGLLDLDLTSPSTHLILGAKDIYPEERNGIIPPKFEGIEYMTMNYYSMNNPSPFRGEDITNAILELLAITKWGELDYLIIDMPPGLGDTMMDVVRYLKRAEFLILTLNSKLSTETARKMIELLQEEKMKILGIVDNMNKDNDGNIKELAETTNIKHLDSIPFDQNLENSLGDSKQLEISPIFSVLQPLLLSHQTPSVTY
ncbi:P-loop NTPase [Candidatus Undinarchaeota archaeon]